MQKPASQLARRLLQPLMDRVIRRKIALHRTPLDRYQVHPARSVKDHEDAFRLLHASYVFQGIESVRAPEMRITPQHALPEAIVLVAREGHEIVGTMTVTLDSAAGLPLDKDYPEDLSALRQQGARLVEYGSLAVVKRCWHTGVTNLLNVAAYRVATEVFGASHTVVGVHPRAEDVYRAVFNFRPLGAARDHSALRAPVLGLVQDMSAAPSFVRRVFRQPMSTGHLPIEHFLGRPLPGVDISAAIGLDRLLDSKVVLLSDVIAHRNTRAAHSLPLGNGTAAESLS